MMICLLSNFLVFLGQGHVLYETDRPNPTAYTSSLLQKYAEKKTKNLSCLCHALRANLSNNFQTDQRNSINSTLAVPITLSANRIRHRFIQSTSSSGTNKTNIMLGDVQSRFMRMDMIKTLPKKDGKGRETKQHFLGEGTDSFENLSGTGQTKHRRVEHG